MFYRLQLSFSQGSSDRGHLSWDTLIPDDADQLRITLPLLWKAHNGKFLGEVHKSLIQNHKWGILGCDGPLKSSRSTRFSFGCTEHKTVNGGL